MVEVDGRGIELSGEALIVVIRDDVLCSRLDVDSA